MLHATSRLYNFIRDNGINRLANNKIRALENRAERQYYLCDLPLRRHWVSNSAGERYNLTGHHLSFYRKRIDHSQYHYTAYFTDANDEHYQLHIYFNENDQTIGQPEFTLHKDSAKQTVATDGLLTHALHELAVAESHDAISELRQAHLQTLAALEQDYDKSMKSLTTLSKDLSRNLPEYQQTLKDSLEILTQLASFHTNKYYAQVRNLLVKRAKVIGQRVQEHHSSDSDDDYEATPATVTTTTTHVAAAVGTRSARAVSSENKKKSPTKPMLEEPAPRKFSIATEIDALKQARDNFLTYHARDLSEHTNLMKLYERAMRQAHLKIVGHDKRIPQDELDTLQELTYEHDQQMRKFLTRLLLSNEFQLAKEIHSYVSLLNPSILAVALRAGKHELLDFLLTYGCFAINTFPLPGNLTPVTYCVAEDSEQTPKVKCLEVLIRHGASLMVRWQGIPVAYQIVSTINHPLKPALMENAEKTLFNESFFRAIANECQRIADCHEIPNFDSRQVAVFTQQAIDQIRACRSIKASAMSSRSRQVSLKLEQSLASAGQAYLTELRNDAQLNIALEVYTHLIKIYLEKTNNKERNLAMQQGMAWCDNASEVLKMVDLSKIDLKADVLKFYKTASQIIQLKLRHLDIKEEAQRHQHMGRRRRNRLIEEERRLVKDINCLAEPMQREQRLIMSLTGQEFLGNDVLSVALESFQESFSKILESLNAMGEFAKLASSLAELTAASSSMQLPQLTTSSTAGAASATSTNLESDEDDHHSSDEKQPDSHSSEPAQGLSSAASSARTIPSIATLMQDIGRRAKTFAEQHDVDPDTNLADALTATGHKLSPAQLDFIKGVKAGDTTTYVATDSDDVAPSFSNN